MDTVYLDPLPYINDRELIFNRYPDEDSANYFSGGVYRFDPRPEYEQDQSKYPA